MATRKVTVTNIQLQSHGRSFLTDRFTCTNVLSRRKYWSRLPLCSSQVKKIVKKAGVTPTSKMRMSIYKDKPNSKHVKVWLKDRGWGSAGWGLTPRASGATLFGSSVLKNLKMETGAYYLTFVNIK